MIEEYKRSCKFTALKPFDYFAEEGHFMELSEWYNGQGFDLHVESSNGAQRLPSPGENGRLCKPWWEMRKKMTKAAIQERPRLRQTRLHEAWS